MAEVIKGHDQILQCTIEILRALPVPPGVELELPPKCAREIASNFLEYRPGDSLIAEITVPQRYANAVGLLQGGFLAAMFDDLMGPLSYLTAKGPTTTLELSTNFLRPVMVGEKIVLVAKVRKAGRSAIHITAEATNSDGKLVATSSTNIQVLKL
jgi:uncharacterized protein (TIGR00369 family)